MKLPPPIPGRVCGECTACCVELAIDDPQLQKPDHLACLHMRSGQGCGIYAARPATCQNWYCGWRFLNLSDAMRPDISGIMLAPEMGVVEGFVKGGLRIVLLHENRGVLLQEELLDFIARCVKGSVPIFLSWGHGRFAKRALVNHASGEAVANGDKAEFVAILRDLAAGLARQVAMDVITAQNEVKA